MPTGRIGTRSFTYTLPTQNGTVEAPIEYEVIAKYADDSYNSIGSYPDLPTAMGAMSNKVLERDPWIKAIYIDKVNMETLENTEYIAITIS